MLFRSLPNHPNRVMIHTNLVRFFFARAPLAKLTPLGRRTKSNADRRSNSVTRRYLCTFLSRYPLLLHSHTPPTASSSRVSNLSSASPARAALDLVPLYRATASLTATARDDVARKKITQGEDVEYAKRRKWVSKSSATAYRGTTEKKGLVDAHRRPRSDIEIGRAHV